MSKLLREYIQAILSEAPGDDDGWGEDQVSDKPLPPVRDAASEWAKISDNATTNYVHVDTDALREYLHALPNNAKIALALNELGPSKVDTMREWLTSMNMPATWYGESTFNPYTVGMSKDKPKYWFKQPGVGVDRAEYALTDVGVEFVKTIKAKLEKQTKEKKIVGSKPPTQGTQVIIKKGVTVFPLPANFNTDSHMDLGLSVRFQDMLVKIENPTTMQWAHYQESYADRQKIEALLPPDIKRGGYQNRDIFLSDIATHTDILLTTDDGQIIAPLDEFKASGKKLAQPKPGTLDCSIGITGKAKLTSDHYITRAAVISIEGGKVLVLDYKKSCIHA